jgi:hypothetical protein
VHRSGNVDEYVSEVELILSGLPACRSADDVELVVQEAFLKMFDEAMIYGARFGPVSVALWNLWQERVHYTQEFNLRCGRDSKT